jgi:hypothetical protein
MSAKYASRRAWALSHGTESFYRTHPRAAMGPTPRNLDSARRSVRYASCAGRELEPWRHIRPPIGSLPQKGYWKQAGNMHHCRLNWGNMVEVFLSCAERERLLSVHVVATDRYVDAVSRLRSSSQDDDFKRLYNLAEDARTEAERSRFNYEKHITEHRCMEACGE